MAVVTPVVERHVRLGDAIARQQAHAQQIDRDADRDVVHEGERKAAQHDIPIGHAQELRHQEGGGAHHRRVDQSAHRCGGLDRGGKGARNAIAHHQRDRDGADHGGIGRAAAADQSDRARPHHGGLRNHPPGPGDQTYDPDHRVLRIEPVGDARQEQERGDQREGELAIDAVDAGRKLHRARGDDATEGGAGMPEEIDRTEKAPERVGDHEHIGPEQYGMREPGQLHHQQENQQPDDVVVLRERSLRIDRDALELIVEMNESAMRRCRDRQRPGDGSRAAAAICRSSPADT